MSKSHICTDLISSCYFPPLCLLCDMQMKLFILNIVCVLLQVTHQNPISHWPLLPHSRFDLYENISLTPSSNDLLNRPLFLCVLFLVLVVEVDGTKGQLPLSCLETPEELTRRDSESQDILWMKNGEETAQRGNSYVVELEESLGGANYTCYSRDGSLLNHTVVLIKEDETKKGKILVKADQGMVISFKTSHC